MAELNRFEAALGLSSVDSVPLPTEGIHHPYDPRPDLTEDKVLWNTVLQTAWQVHGESEFYYLLHGLRCGGCRLERKPEGSLRLDYDPMLDAWKKEHLLNQWLKPATRLIVDVFKRAEATLAGLPPGQRMPAWAKTG